MRTHRNVTLYVHCLSCFFLILTMLENSIQPYSFEFTDEYSLLCKYPWLLLLLLPCRAQSLSCYNSIFVDYVPCASKHLVLIYSEDRQREYHRTRKDLHHQEKQEQIPYHTQSLKTTFIISKSHNSRHVVTSSSFLPPSAFSRGFRNFAQSLLAVDSFSRFLLF